MDQRFSSVRRGYDPEQVDAFLVAIASNIEALEAELQRLRVTPPSSAEVAPEGPMKRSARLIEVGEREIERMLGEAKTEAATTVSEARSEADRVTNDARDTARRSVDEARAFLSQVEGDAAKMLSDVAERRRQMMGELQKMQEHLVSVARDLDLVLNPEGS
jgi:DivIVA domain-containing protein